MLTQIIQDSFSLSEVCQKLGWTIGGASYRKLHNFIDANSIDVSHFDPKRLNRKWERITKICPVCGLSFETKLGFRDEKFVCSRACSNTYFRSGKDNGNWSQNRYGSTCFEYHAHKCIICDEDKIVAVHHFDENRKNNDPINLIPLCMNHHQYYHSKYRYLVQQQIIDYREAFIKTYRGVGE